MLKNLTEGVASAVQATTTPITNTASTILSNVSNILSSDTLTDPSKSIIGTVTDTISDTVTGTTTNLVTNTTQLLIGNLITPLWNFLRRYLIIAIIVLLPVIIGLAITVLIIFGPFIILTSPIWVPTGTVLLLVTAAFLFVCGFIVVAVVATLLLAYRYYKQPNTN